MEPTSQSPQEAFETWLKGQVDRISEHLYKRGVLKDKARMEWDWILPHKVVIGRTWHKHNPARKFWVIAGNVPVDHASLDVADDARAAARYFAMRWQLQGARVGLAAGDDEDRPSEQIDWKKIENSLSDLAEWLYAVSESDEQWNQPDAIVKETLEARAEGQPFFNDPNEST